MKPPVFRVILPKFRVQFRKTLLALRTVESTMQALNLSPEVVELMSPDDLRQRYPKEWQTHHDHLIQLRKNHSKFLVPRVTPKTIWLEKIPIKTNRKLMKESGPGMTDFHMRNAASQALRFLQCEINHGAQVRTAERIVAYWRQEAKRK